MVVSKINPISFKANIYNTKLRQKPVTPKDNLFEESDIYKIGRRKGIKVPDFNTGKSIKYDEIVEFHKSIEQRKDRDKLSYSFYTTTNDIGSGFFILGLPITKEIDSKTKEEMLNEVNRLVSNTSTLSVNEKRMLQFLYQSKDCAKTASLILPGAVYEKRTQ